MMYIEDTVSKRLQTVQKGIFKDGKSFLLTRGIVFVNSHPQQDPNV